MFEREGGQPRVLKRKRALRAGELGEAQFVGQLGAITRRQRTTSSSPAGPIRSTGSARPIVPTSKAAPAAPRCGPRGSA